MSTEVGHSQFIKHLLLLRSALLKCLLIVSLLFIISLFFAKELYHLLALPLIAQLPIDSKMIAIGVITPLFIPIKFALIFSIFCAMPIILYQLWRFVAPGLYQHEKHFMVILLFCSIILFYAGVAFAYFVVCPLLFHFILQFAPSNVAIMPDIQYYLDFVLRFFFAFGLAFEVPILLLLLVKAGITDVAALGRKRPYFIVIAFITGMLLTPPDILSQILLAIPLCLLYELGLLLSKLVLKSKTTRTAVRQQ